MLKELLLELVIVEVENWAGKQAQKIAGSEKMKKAMEKAREAQANLQRLGIKVDLPSEDTALEKLIQSIFDKLKNKLG